MFAIVSMIFRSDRWSRYALWLTTILLVVISYLTGRGSISISLDLGSWGIFSTGPVADAPMAPNGIPSNNEQIYKSTSMKLRQYAPMRVSQGEASYREPLMYSSGGGLRKVNSDLAFPISSYFDFEHVGGSSHLMDGDSDFADGRSQKHPWDARKRYETSLALNEPMESDHIDAVQGSTSSEAVATLQLAVQFKGHGKIKKAERLFKHATSLMPRNPDILAEFGLFMEKEGQDVVQAEQLYKRALRYSPGHSLAAAAHARTSPLVEDIDNRMLDAIDMKRQYFNSFSHGSGAMKRAKREAYYQHVHHTVAIEGNTMSLVQTRHILESRMAVSGKSIMEHNEILGLDLALRYLDQHLVNKLDLITIEDLLELHKRVLGFVDPVEAGLFRRTQVFVGDFTPTPPDLVLAEMADFIDWLNDEATQSLHPVELAALAHYKFVYIHPFVDGNGRTARLLMNLFLMRNGYPPVIIRVEERLEYYRTLKMANDGDLRPFIRFIAGATGRTLDEYLGQLTTEGGGNVMAPDTPKTTDSDGVVIPPPANLHKGKLASHSNDDETPALSYGRRFGSGYDTDGNLQRKEVKPPLKGSNTYNSVDIDTSDEVERSNQHRGSKRSWVDWGYDDVSEGEFDENEPKTDSNSEKRTGENTYRNIYDHLGEKIISSNFTRFNDTRERAGPLYESDFRIEE